jgi:hypothetical protein
MCTPINITSVIPKLCSVDPKGSATTYQEIRGYISVMTALKFTYFLIKCIVFYEK